MSTPSLFCCYIADENQEAAKNASADEIRALGCQELAEWMIIDGPAPDDYTHACTAHVGFLLSDSEDIRVFSLRPIVVPDTMTSSEANEKYGERFGVDWTYPEKEVVV